MCDLCEVTYIFFFFFGGGGGSVGHHMGSPIFSRAVPKNDY